MATWLEMHAIDRRIEVHRAEEAADARYADMLDETCEAFRIGDCSYDPSRVLKEVDPIAYREGFLNYTDGWCETCWTDPEDSDGPHAEWCEHFTDDEEDGSDDE